MYLMYDTQESPLPVDPSMFPTWPAKSEMVKKSARHRSPTAPEGGAFLLQQKVFTDLKCSLSLTLSYRVKKMKRSFI